MINQRDDMQNGFFSVLQIFGRTLGAAGIFVLILKNAAFFLSVILLLLGLMVIAFRLIGENKVFLYQARQEICSWGIFI